MNALERDFFTDPARVDDLELLDPGALSYAPSFLIRGLNDLPLRFRCHS